MELLLLDGHSVVKGQEPQFPELEVVNGMQDAELVVSLEVDVDCLLYRYVLDSQPAVTLSMDTVIAGPAKPASPGHKLERAARTVDRLEQNSG